MKRLTVGKNLIFSIVERRDIKFKTTVNGSKQIITLKNILQTYSQI